MATSLELAITAIRSGRKDEGRQLLNLLIQQNPNNEMAWLWMSSVVDSDEQRARCLYHVLAIDPDNAVARQGLKVLGIVVSDSRPVKVPRDSQPIKIPKPSSKLQTGPLKALPEPKSTLSPVEERRPFRLDPQAVVDELPFTPVKAPFTQKLEPVFTDTLSANEADLSSADVPETSQMQTERKIGAPQNTPEPIWVKRAKVIPKPVPHPKRQTGPLPTPSEPVPLAAVSTNPTKTPQSIAGVKINFSPQIAPRQKPQTDSLQNPPGPAPVASSNANETPAPKSQQAQSQATTLPNPSEPVQVGSANNSALANSPSQDLPWTDPSPGSSASTPQLPNQGQTQSLQNPSGPAPVTQYGPPAIPQSQVFANDASPMASPQSNPGTGPLQQPQPTNSGGSQHWTAQSSLSDTGPLEGATSPAQQFDNRGMPVHETRPTQPMPTPYPNPTMGMQPYPFNNGQQPYGAAAFHSNMTMGMPIQPPAQPHPQIHSQATMGVPINSYAAHPSEPVPMVHSNPTMAMPFPAQLQGQPLQSSAIHSNSTMAMQPGQPGLVDYRVASTSRSWPSNSQKNKYKEEEEDEGINILAVIIFGSLSVTALGGLGMLILLMFTAN